MNERKKNRKKQRHRNPQKRSQKQAIREYEGQRPPGPEEHSRKLVRRLTSPSRRELRRSL